MADENLNAVDVPADSRISDITGKRFGFLVVDAYLGVILIRRRRRRTSAWLCRCDCGADYIAAHGPLTRGDIKSCGCQHFALISQANRRHGNCKHPLFRVYASMVRRCHDKRNKSFAYYGGRGITVCERWRNDFVAFASDMGERPTGASLERVDNSKGYSPDNCRWASRREQMRNTRHNVNITFAGQTMCMKAWADAVGISLQTLATRLNRHGWSAERALTTPVRVCVNGAEYFRPLNHINQRS